MGAVSFVFLSLVDEVGFVVAEEVRNMLLFAVTFFHQQLETDV